MIEPAYYHGRLTDFLAADPDSILGQLARAHSFDVDILQKNAWLAEISNLKLNLQHLSRGHIFFELSIPRMGKRADVVLLVDGLIFVLEFKIGADTYDRFAQDQTIDYALDLKSFHLGSHAKHIVPILIATEAIPVVSQIQWSADDVSNTLKSDGLNLSSLIQLAIASVPPQDDIDPRAWMSSGYRPTPTIVEAAQALYQGHSVDEITRSDAGAINLRETSDCVSEVIRISKDRHRKSICFVTGVPGAGKTLAGLNVAVRESRSNEPSVFLSGNGPLVDVLREALIRDDYQRGKARGLPVTKKGASARVKTFIQNVHHFRDDALVSDKAPVEHVVIFDEAQRAWNKDRAENFMRQKRGITDFSMSEPEFLISVMDRHEDWCTVVCLIGGGQEINTGEAGITEWFDALKKRFAYWDVYISNVLSQQEYSWGQDLPKKLQGLNVITKSGLHLAVSIRSFRAEEVSAFVDAIVDGDHVEAHRLHALIDLRYPVRLTRDIETARAWLRKQQKGTQRSGIVASSGAMRLKPEGINVNAAVDPPTWFLNGKDDVRSSYYLEDVATEFDIQGLELDWSGVCWDADFRRLEHTWGLYNFKGTKWQRINDAFRQVYLANSYRVLLTRARQGMVIFVPKGDPLDETRPPIFYDLTYQFLLSCGIEAI
jgi:hypothetical protein